MFKILVLLLIIVGSMMQLDDLWDFVDFGVAFLVLFNVYALLKMKGTWSMFLRIIWKN